MLTLLMTKKKGEIYLCYLHNTTGLWFNLNAGNVRLKAPKNINTITLYKLGHCALILENIT
jgi:hypothetical protein